MKLVMPRIDLNENMCIAPGLGGLAIFRPAHILVDLEAIARPT